MLIKVKQFNSKSDVSYFIITHLILCCSEALFKNISYKCALVAVNFQLPFFFLLVKTQIITAEDAPQQLPVVSGFCSLWAPAHSAQGGQKQGVQGRSGAAWLVPSSSPEAAAGSAASPQAAALTCHPAYPSSVPHLPP